LLDSLKVLNAKPSLLEKLKRAKVAHSGVGSAEEQAAYAALFTCLRKANSGADAEAERECLAAETDEPSTARFARGLLAKRRGESSEARRFFSAAVEAAPTIPDNHNYLARHFKSWVSWTVPKRSIAKRFVWTRHTKRQ